MLSLHGKMQCRVASVIGHVGGCAVFQERAHDVVPAAYDGVHERRASVASLAIDTSSLRDIQLTGKLLQTVGRCGVDVNIIVDEAFCDPGRITMIPGLADKRLNPTPWRNLSPPLNHVKTWS